MRAARELRLDPFGGRDDSEDAAFTYCTSLAVLHNYAQEMLSTARAGF